MRSTGFYSRILSDLGGRGDMIRLAVLNAARIALYGSSRTTLKPIRLLWASLASKKRAAVARVFSFEKYRASPLAKPRKNARARADTIVAPFDPLFS